MRENLAMEIIQTIVDIILFILKCCWLISKAVVKLIIPVRPKSVNGEIVLITGAGNGIGRELALQYASQGAIVVCWDIDEKGNLETVDKIANLGYPKAYAYVCNVANREAVMQVAEKVQKDVGDVTILINNAGIILLHSVLNVTAEELRRITDINVMAHYWTLQAFLPTMIRNNHGHIVALSSVAGLMGIKIIVPYSATKFAVRGMMEALYNDLHVDPKCNIKTTCIYPFVVNTAICDMKHVNIKYPKLMPILEPKYVAKCIINAQRRNVMEVSIPGYMLTLLKCSRFLPSELSTTLNEIINLESDL